MPSEPAGSSSQWFAAAIGRAESRKLSSVTTDERHIESGPSTALDNRTATSIYGSTPVSGAATVAPAIVARRALGHLGGIPRSPGRNSGVDSRRAQAKDCNAHRQAAGVADSCAASAHAIADTNRLMAAYELEMVRACPIRRVPNVLLLSSVLHCYSMPVTPASSPYQEV